MTTDREAAWQFYRDVLGWQITASGPEMGHYGMASVGGRMVAGLGTPPDPSQAPPPLWSTYLACEDVDKTLEAIVANGGQIAVPVMDVGEAGRMAMAVDPTGASFALWQARDFIGAGLVGEPGGMVWNQCMTRDPERAREFYAAVFDYRYTAMEGGFDYVTIDGDAGGMPRGGIGRLDDSAPPEPLAVWDVYFQVADVDAAAAAVTAGGGTVMQPPYDTPFGRMTTCRDAQGAAFSIMHAVAEPST